MLVETLGMGRSLDDVRALSAELREVENLRDSAAIAFREAVYKAWREGHSQVEIAEAAGISRQRVSQIIGSE